MIHKSVLWGAVKASPLVDLKFGIQYNVRTNIMFLNLRMGMEWNEKSAMPSRYCHGSKHLPRGSREQTTDPKFYTHKIINVKFVEFHDNLKVIQISHTLAKCFETF